MRLFVTGATGFIGLHLCRRLIADGHQVIALVRSPSKLPPDVASAVEPLRGDLSIFDEPDRVLPEVDVVVHLAAVIAGKNEAEYAAINYGAVESLLACLKRQAWEPKRLLFASSLAAAGPSPHGRRWTEDDPLAPIDPYGEAKCKAEALLRTQPFPTTAFRPPIVLGPGDDATLTLYKMARSGLAALPAGTEQTLSWVNVDDLVDALVRLASDTSPLHRTYYIASEELTTNRQLLRAMAAAQGRNVAIVPVPKALLYCAMLFATFASALFHRRNQLDRKQYAQMVAPAFACTSAKLSADTGWRARCSLEQTLTRSVEGYRTLGRL